MDPRLRGDDGTNEFVLPWGERVSFPERMLQIDRRIIFAVIGLCTLLPLLYPVGLPIKKSPEVVAIYDHMESLPEGSVFLVSMDFDPASKPELEPQAKALLRHAFSRNLRVIVITLIVTGTGLAEQILNQVAQEQNKVSGEDYVFLGWSPGAGALIIAMCQNLSRAFPSDYYGQATDRLPVLNGVRGCNEIDYAVSLAAGFPGIEDWYIYGKDKYDFELAGGATGVLAPGLYPFYRSGQINGLMGGLRGAAEYEGLIKHKGSAMAGMDAQSAAHFAIIALVLACNIFYFLGRRAKKNQEN